MAKLSAFRSDTRAINDGAWIRVDDAAYGDLDIMSRGYTDEFVDAQNARLMKAAEPFLGDRDRIPNSVRREINAGLLRDFLVIDVRNLEGDDGKPVSVEQFHDMLEQPEYAKLQRACWLAAGRITTRAAEQAKAAAGN
jgi:hypothetical protein